MVEAAETVIDPGAERRLALAVATGVEEELCGGVIEFGGMHGPHESEVISDGANVGEQFAEESAGLAIVLEPVSGAEQFWVAGQEGEAFAFEKLFWGELPVVFLEDGFVIVEVELGGGADEVDEENVPCLGRLWRDSGRFGGIFRSCPGRVQKFVESNGAKGGGVEEGSAVERHGVSPGEGFHGG